MGHIIWGRLRISLRLRALSNLSLAGSKARSRKLCLHSAVNRYAFPRSEPCFKDCVSFLSSLLCFDYGSCCF